MSAQLTISSIICSCHPCTFTIKVYGGILSQIYNLILPIAIFYSTSGQPPEFKVGTKSVNIFVFGTLIMWVMKTSFHLLTLWTNNVARKLLSRKKHEKDIHRQTPKEREHTLLSHICGVATFNLRISIIKSSFVLKLARAGFYYLLVEIYCLI